MFLAVARSHGWLSDSHIATIMADREWPEVISDFKQSELIDVTATMWPDTQYLWVVRNPADTVASLVANRWYLPSDDNYPPGFIHYYGTWNEGLADINLFNGSGNRTRGDMVGDFTGSEWADMNQVERCGWWWAYINNLIGVQLEKIPDRASILKLEDHPELVQENTSTTKPVTGWEPYVEKVAEKLGYGG